MAFERSMGKLTAILLLVTGCQFVCSEPLFGIVQEEGQREEDPKYFYYFNDEKIPLTLDHSKLLLRRTGEVPVAGTSEELRNAWESAKKNPPALLDRHGIPPERVRARDDVQMWEIDLSDRKLKESDVEEIIDRLSTDDSLEFVAPAFRSRDGGAYLLTGRITIRFVDGISDQEASRVIAETCNAQIVQRKMFDIPEFVSIRPETRNGVNILFIAQKLHTHPRIQFAEPHAIVEIKRQLIPQDGGFGLQWGLRNTGQFGGFADTDIDADEAWDVTLGQAEDILVLDDGVQLNHPDLNVDPNLSRDFTEDPPVQGGGPTTPDDNHGTAVAGVISARINSIGTVGVAPGSFVVSAKIVDSMGGGETIDLNKLAAAIRYSSTANVRITNSSFTLGGPSPTIAIAYEDTFAAGVVHFAASGNSSPPDIVGFPASLPCVIAVGAIDSQGLIAPFSNRGSGLELVGPGQDIYTTDRVGTAGFNCCEGMTNYVIIAGLGIDGTSFASPHAAGVAALMRRLNPGLTPEEIRTQLQITAFDVSPQVYGHGYDTTTGHGLVNAAAAIQGLPIAGDANRDGFVDVNDISYVVFRLGLMGTTTADVDGSGFVDVNDISFVVARL